jgi:hypothetical protein
MTTTFQVRKAATSQWIRKNEDEWIRTSRASSVESKIGRPSSPRPSFGPVRELLTCDKPALPGTGRDILRWLDEQKNIQASILDWLSHRVISGRVTGQVIGDFNRIAAIEILARYDHRSAPQLIERYLAEPIRENHLYAMPLARLQQTIKSQEAKSLAENIVRLYGESKTIEPAARWRERFVVETFRTLVELSPANAVGAISGDLASIADFELTAVLESISQAARKVDRTTLTQSPLKLSLKAVWNRYIEDKSAEELGNRPGIMGRLLELLGRVGEDLRPYFESLDQHPLKMQVLYQFVRRPLDFAKVNHRFRWYADALKLMADAKQSFAITKFLTEVVVPDMPPDFQKNIIGTLTKNQSDRPTTP